LSLTSNVRRSDCLRSISFSTIPATRLSKARTHEQLRQSRTRFIAAMEKQPNGVKLGPQELDGEIVPRSSGAIFNAPISTQRAVAEAPPLDRIIVAPRSRPAHPA